jgi:hypothetical protein
MTTTKKYAFVTIVAPEAVRAEFTQLRNELKTTDKQLMQALWNIAQSDLGAVAHELEGLKEVAMQLKHIKAITVGDEPKVAIAAKAKKAPAKKEVIAKEPAKKKAPKKSVKFEGKDEPEIFVGEEDCDMPCMVVDGL